MPKNYKHSIFLSKELTTEEVDIDEEGSTFTNCEN